jgi:prolyl 4-hydroxylase
MAGHASSQHVTPELRKWIVDQAQAGHPADVVLKSMRDAGWDEDVAIDAMETALSAHLAHSNDAAAQAPGVPVPEPDLSGAPLYLDAGDRRVSVLSVVGKPRIVVFGNLLSDEECDALIDEARPHMARSRTVATKTGGEELNVDRTSDGMFFQRAQTPLIERIEARIARLVRWPVQNGEGLQILRYSPGTEYKPHYDYFDPGEPGTPSMLRRGGQRVGTLVIYLGEPEQGGATVFPDIALEVAPKRGNAVFFSYERPHPNTRTLHGGTPVLLGEKWIATKWLREREFE